MNYILYYNFETSEFITERKTIDDHIQENINIIRLLKRGAYPENIRIIGFFESLEEIKQYIETANEARANG